MLEDIKVLASRRAYKFRPDNLRLAMLCTKPIQDGIQKLFHFKSASIDTPKPIFGEVPRTFPPGLVFKTGLWVSPEGQLVPIRSLHFEQHRIVIDVSGLSAATASILEVLQQFLASIRAPDGSPVLGAIEQALDYSELSVQFSEPLDVMLTSPLRELFLSKSKDKILVPTLLMHAYTAGQEVTAIPTFHDSNAFTLTLRVGTRPEDHIYFSGAPLDSEAHIAYLNALQDILKGSKQ